jgi:molecular chaperone GrpE
MASMDEQDREVKTTGEPAAQDPEAQVVEEAQAERPAEKQEEEEAVEELTALRQELEEARANEAEYLDGWQRARAELSNARKRFQRDREQAYSNARADVLVQLLPVTDDFERAFETLPDNLASLTWIEGVMLIQRKLQLLLQQASVVPIEATGQEFDPFMHEAVTHEPSATVPAGQIIAELQRGYKMGDRVLRPSVVRVSSGPLPDHEPAEPEAEPEAGSQAVEEAQADDNQT